VAVPLSAAAIPSWGDFFLLSPTAMSCAADAAAPLEMNGCTLLLRPGTAASGRVASVTVSLAGSSLTAAVAVRLWYPVNVWLQPDLYTLHSVLPINANLAQATPGCGGSFQASGLRGDDDSFGA